MGIEIIAAWFFKDLRSRARTDLEGVGSLRNPYCRLDAALPKRMPTHTADARLNSCGHQMILANLARPERIPRGWIHKDPWRIIVLCSFSMFLQNDCQI